MYRTVVVYDWPTSQLCFDCVHSQPLYNETNSAVCDMNCKLSNGESCPMFIQKDEIDE